MLRQPRLQVRAQGLGIAVTLSGAKEVGRELRAAGCNLVPDNGHVAHPRVSGKHRFDFFGLDSKASNLELLVAAAQELEGAVRLEPYAVARQVKPTSLSVPEPVGNETLPGEVGSIEISTRNTCAPDA